MLLIHRQTVFQRLNKLNMQQLTVKINALIKQIKHKSFVLQVHYKTKTTLKVKIKFKKYIKMIITRLVYFLSGWTIHAAEKTTNFTSNNTQSKDKQCVQQDTTIEQRTSHTNINTCMHTLGRNMFPSKYVYLQSTVLL